MAEQQWWVLQGDCLEVLKSCPDNHFDALCTDPPAGIGFMNLKFDSDRGGRDHWIAWLTEVMRECYRVMKPGAHGFVWSLPRTSYWTAMALDNSGFDVRECVLHVFGSGFPKSQDVGKAIDRFGGSKGETNFRDQQVQLARHIRERRKAHGLKTEEVMGWFPYREVVRNWERTDAGNRVPSIEDYELLIERLGCDIGFRQFCREEAERQVLAHVGGGLAQGWAQQGNAGYQKDYDITAPATDEAKQWDGWGSALKPATEIWWLVRKPLSESSIAKNVLKWGTGALNIDACRVNRATDDVPGWHKSGAKGSDGYLETDTFRIRDMSAEEIQERCGNKGRFPPNLVLSHAPDCRLIGVKKVKTAKGVRGSDAGNTMSGGGRGLNRPITGQEVGYGDDNGLETVEHWECVEGCPVAELDRQSGVTKSNIRPPTGVDRRGTPGFVIRIQDNTQRGHKDSGGASRFFPTFRYQAKPSRSEREAGLDELEERTLNRVNPGGIEREPRFAPVQVKNNHPTCKSVELMKWLITLITPPGGIILDPFAGSGTTGCAAVQLGFKFIGIDESEEYCEIARARLAYWEKEASG